MFGAAVVLRVCVLHLALSKVELRMERPSRVPSAHLCMQDPAAWLALAFSRARTPSDRLYFCSKSRMAAQASLLPAAVGASRLPCTSSSTAAPPAAPLPCGQELGFLPGLVPLHKAGTFTLQPSPIWAPWSEL